MNSTLSIVSEFKRKSSFLFLIHYCPDGDAIASSLGLRLALKALNKTVDVVCADPIPHQFLFLPDVRSIKQDFFIGDYEAIVTLDCGDSKRTGFRNRLKALVKHKKITLINIDHHPKNDLHALATHNYVDESAPSTSYQVHKIIHELGVPVDHKIATCLLTGLYTDTGGFKHPNTTVESLQFAALMLSKGARLKDITTYISQPSSVARLKLWGLALSRVQRHKSFNIVSTFITQKDIAKTQTTDEDIGGIAALLGTIPAEIAVLVVQSANNTVQVRMRTKSKWVNLAELASYLGGGGKKKAAGFAINGTIPLERNTMQLVNFNKQMEEVER